LSLLLSLLLLSLPRRLLLWRHLSSHWLGQGVVVCDVIG
jgi:hypothetical protein